MLIKLSHVVPTPLSDAIPADSIWQGETTIQSPGHYLIKANSGKGKSTLINLLYGTRKDYTGTISFDGIDIRSYSLLQTAELRQRSISIVFQDLMLFPDLSARQNIMLKHKLAPGIPTEEIDVMANALGIAQKLEQKCGLLSLGQQQRVAIIRALVQPFHFLLMDEPFSHLDKDNIREAIMLISKRCEQQQAGFIITSLGDHYDIEYDQVFSV